MRIGDLERLVARLMQELDAAKKWSRLLTASQPKKWQAVMKPQGIFPTPLLCRLLALPRSSYYYSAHPRDDTTLQTQLRTVCETYATYGILRLTKQLRRDYQVVSEKRARRVAQRMGIPPKNKRKNYKPPQVSMLFRATQYLVLALPITYLDQV